MKKKILFVNGHLNAGGVEKSLADILVHMDYNKFDVDLVLFEDFGDYVSDLPANVNVRLVDLRNTYGSLPKVLLRCAKMGDWFSFRMRLLLFLSGIFDARILKLAGKMIFGSTHYDVAIGFRPGICTNIVAFAAKAEEKITWWHHGEYNLDGAGERNYILACREMDHVVSVSESCAGFLRNHIPELDEKLTVIPNLISPDSIRQKAVLSQPYDSDSICHIVSVGRLSQEKHMENCIHAAAVLRDSGYSNFLWHIVGDGAERETLEAMAAEQGISGWIRFEGRQANPYPYVKNADLFVHPSYVESQGIVILEAMVLGVPCVVTKSLGPCEFMEDGVNGILTEQTPESLAQKVLQMRSDRTLYDQIKRNTNCPRSFLPERVMEQIDTLLEAIT